MGTEITVRPQAAVLSIDELTGQVRTIQEAMKAVMRDGEHYGTIPGTGSKPTLLKPGAEKLCLLFRLNPQYEIQQERDGNHLTVVANCTLYHIPNGNAVASGVGMCSTLESKYAYRKAERTCPGCGEAAIIKGRDEFGGGWLCFKKKGGCGMKFPDGAEVIEAQQAGRVVNEDLPDTWNTVVKMASKRALVAAVLNGTAASDIFTQDIEDLPEPKPQQSPEAPPVPPPSNVDQATGEILEATDPAGQTLVIDGDTVQVVDAVKIDDATDGEDADSIPFDDVPDRLAHPPHIRALFESLDLAQEKKLKGFVSRAMVLSRVKKTWKGVQALEDLQPHQVARVLEQIVQAQGETSDA